MAMVILFVVIIGLACCQGLRRQTPYNFILLGVFTLAQSFVLGTIYQVIRFKESQLFLLNFKLDLEA